MALCPRCYAIYSIDDNEKICKELKGVKKILAAHQQNIQLLDDLPLEKGIVGVISKVKKLKEKDLSNASLDPKEIKQKLKPTDDMALYVTVNAYVTTYYIKLREIMISMWSEDEVTSFIFKLSLTSKSTSPSSSSNFS